MRILYLIILCIALSACGPTIADARIAEAQAQQAAAQSQAQQAEAWANALGTVATSNANTVPAWLVVVLLLVIAVPACIGLWWFGRVRYVQAVARVQIVQKPARLLPGDPGFYRALHQVASESGATVHRNKNGYYLVADGWKQPVAYLEQD